MTEETHDDGTQSMLDGILDDMAALRQRVEHALSRCTLPAALRAAWDQLEEELEDMPTQLACHDCASAATVEVPGVGDYCETHAALWGACATCDRPVLLRDAIWTEHGPTHPVCHGQAWDHDDETEAA